MVVSVFAVTASAERLPLNFYVTAASDKQVSAVNPKDDYDTLAYIFTTSHNITTSDSFWYRILCGPYTTSEAASSFKRVTPSNASYNEITYYDGYAWAGARRYLMADTDKYNVRAEGNWWS